MERPGTVGSAALGIALYVIGINSAIHKAGDFTVHGCLSTTGLPGIIPVEQRRSVHSSFPIIHKVDNIDI